MSAEITEMIPLISEHGVTIALAAALIWQHMRFWQTVNKVLADLRVSSELQTNIMSGLQTALNGIQKSCDNTASALTIINNSILTAQGILERHAAHAEKIQGIVSESNTLLKLRQNGGLHG